MTRPNKFFLITGPMITVLLATSLSKSCAGQDEGRKELPVSDVFAAAGKGEVDVIRDALAQGMSPDVQMTDGETLLLRAIPKGHIGIVKLLLDKGAKVNKSDSFGKTPLMYAAGCSETGIVRLLLSHGATVRTIATGRFNRGDRFTALHYASLFGPPTNAEILLTHGADPNAQDWYRMTPLHYAAKRGDATIVSLLLHYGAKTDLKNTAGKLPKDLVLRGSDAVGRLLLRTHPKKAESRGYQLPIDQNGS